MNDNTQRDLQTELWWAVAGGGDEAKVRRLLEAGIDPNIRDPFTAVPPENGKESLSLLALAIESKRPKVVRLLLEHGADPNILAIIGPYGNEMSPFSFTTVFGRHAFAIETALLEHGAKVTGSNLDVLSRCGKYGEHLIEIIKRYYPEDVMEWWCKRPEDRKQS